MMISETISYERSGGARGINASQFYGIDQSLTINAASETSAGAAIILNQNDKYR